MNQDPPPHKSEKMFRRYEKALQAILTHYPQACSFDPKAIGLATSTFSCRLRDAASSLFEYHWTSPVDESKLREIWPYVEITFAAGMVIARQRGAKQLSAVQGPSDIASDKDSFAFTLDRPTPQEIVASAILLDKKHIKLPIKVKNCAIEEIVKLTANFDVAVTNDDRGFIIML